MPQTEIRSKRSLSLREREEIQEVLPAVMVEVQRKGVESMNVDSGGN